MPVRWRRSTMAVRGRPGPFLSVRRRLTAAFSLILAFVLLGGVVGVAALSLVDRTARELVLTDRPLSRFNADVLQALTDAQTSQRGYLLTGDERFMEYYGPGLSRFTEAVAAARFHAGGGEVARLLDSEAAAGHQWITQFAEPVVLLQRTDPAAARQLVQSGRGQALFDRFRAAHATTDRAVTARFDARLEQVRQTVRIIGQGLALLAAVVLIVGAAIGSYTTGVLVAPLAKLRATLARLQGGDLGARAVPEGPTEIRAVAGSVNALAIEIERLRGLHAERVERERTIRTVSATIREHLEVETIVERIACSVGPALGMQQAAVRFQLADEVGPVAAEWHEPDLAFPDGEPAEVATALTDLLGSIDEPILCVPEVSEADWLPAAVRQYLLRRGARSVVWRQLRAGPTALAVLELVSTDAAAQWTAGQAHLLDAFACEIEGTLSHALLYERQRQIADRLRELDRAKTDFVSTVSHELRTPLTSIVGYLEMLGEGDVGELSDEQRGAFDVVERNVARLLALIEDLLVLSRIESGAFNVSLAPVDLTTLLRDIVSEFSPRTTAQSITLVGEVDAGLSARADRAQVERVLLNLLTNAAKFTPPGGRVTVRAEVRDGFIDVSVTDTGIGITREEQQHLFKRFFRSSRAQDAAIPGTGLGLAICKSIVELHGGAIDVESEPGQGTTFRFTVPELAQPADIEEGAGQPRLIQRRATR